MIPAPGPLLPAAPAGPGAPESPGPARGRQAGAGAAAGAPPAPGLLPPRAGPALPATLLLGLGPERDLSTEVVITPARPGSSSAPAAAVTVLAWLADGRSLPATVLPARGDHRAHLAVGPLVLRLESAADLPEGALVEVRLATPPGSGPGGADQPRRAARSEAEGPALPRLAADARLAAGLRAAADGLAHAPAAPPADQPLPAQATRLGPDLPSLLLLGDPAHPVPLRVSPDPAARRPAHDSASEASLSLDLTLAQLGRIRLEVRAHGRGEIGITLRSERRLPAEAHERLRDLAGAAFELGGRPAWFLAVTGPLPPAAPLAGILG